MTAAEFIVDTVFGGQLDVRQLCRRDQSVQEVDGELLVCPGRTMDSLQQRMHRVFQGAANKPTMRNRLKLAHG